MNLIPELARTFDADQEEVRSRIVCNCVELRVNFDLNQLGSRGC